MASPNRGESVLHALIENDVDTGEDVKQLRNKGRTRIKMKPCLEDAEDFRGVIYASRKRMRHDAIRHFREGHLGISSFILDDDAFLDLLDGDILGVKA